MNRLELSPLNKHNLSSTQKILPEGPPRTGIVHIGIGNFHRAHLSVYTAEAVAKFGGDWGIFGYSAYSPQLAQQLTKQDLLYSVVDIAPDTDTINVPAIHTAAVSGATGAQAAVAEIGKKYVKIVSLTVTEAGYTFSPTTGTLDSSLPDVAADLDGVNPPRTPIGQIVRGLQLRARSHKTPITILSCDNLSDNGNYTKRVVEDFVNLLPSDERDELSAYISSSVTFPNSMVDRIVPGTDDTHRQLAQDRLGLVDTVPVPAEPFRMWVLEDKFAAGRPAWDKVGAIFAEDVAPYELMKLRLLNGTHSLLAYLGALDGHKTIPEARFEPFIEEAARNLLNVEYLPTLTVPDDIDASRYIEQLFSRWSNTVLADPTSRVGSDGSVKLPQRITEPARFHISAGRMPHYLCLTVAAYLACLAPLAGFDPGPYARDMVDPSKEQLKSMAAKSSSPRQLVHTVFTDGQIFSPALAHLPGFTEQIANYLEVIISQGIRAAALAASHQTLTSGFPLQGKGAAQS